ncbi:3-hydroxyacyl-CoA dehydrogenase [Colletotrichum abscissum]|uniref:3-hydroxyacyl-CoA dehydrogenase n=1 Tax=Colletotrichum abscissum TaxID=1671311 RepID=A0A9P9XMK2_9PEZI|nr:3-hydroxyacyl-CoA dehydrogenase [Colletotrichum abscissum]KAI3556524.1 3-hydroxyacyl-CoA dehydrogenase [Colletotrichum abscissum]KAK1475415.1 3-hydroxyacyl-CoA dehydrogenase [Colletotrichum abscissum]
MPSDVNERVALVGLGAIGISFAALYLRHTKSTVRVFDTRPDLEHHLSTVLPGYIDSDDASLGISRLRESGRLVICTTLEEACDGATIVQEQVVHPFNPPHIMPLIEIVPSPTTNPDEVRFAKKLFAELGSGHRPVVIKKEVPGFVGNRLAFSLLREACSLVDQGVVSTEDVDTIMEASLGPRWAVQGIFKSYNMGGGVAGIQAFLNNLSGTVQGVWDSSEPVNFQKKATNESEGIEKSDGPTWDAKVVQQTVDAYGLPNPEQFRERDVALRKILDVQRQRETHTKK